jgi:cytochrome c oxidase cbb3-type subunit 2/cytochrome c oxidase cbb3-type subunit I/II
MTPALLFLGGLIVFWAAVVTMVFMPASMMRSPPSDIWRPMTAEETAGFRLFVQNGCTYCHTQFIRTIDWDLGAERISEAGDYHGMEPAIVGTERTGPDLAQEGGEHPDDWHLAHFVNPRFTRPVSLMPAWEFLGPRAIGQLTAYVQFEGMKNADYRVARQAYWKAETVAAFARGFDFNVEWLHAHVPETWRTMPNPYPATEAGLERGKKIYQQFCTGCHGPIGDGQGPAAPYLDPQPLNFTTLRRHLVEGRYIGGIFYFQIMNGITGSAMPYFKRDLESEKIWDLANYLAVSFLGYTDAGIGPKGIDAAYEPAWKNTFDPPNREGFSHGLGFVHGRPRSGP